MFHTFFPGTIPGYAHTYSLDDHHVFEAGRPMLVCGNTASMVGESWLAPHFTVTGTRDVHYGLFDCSTPSGSVTPDGGSAAAACEPSPLGGSCC